MGGIRGQAGRIDSDSVIEAYCASWNVTRVAETLRCCEASVRKALDRPEVRTGLLGRIRDREAIFAVAATQALYLHEGEARALFQRRRDDPKCQARDVVQALHEWGESVERLGRCAGLITERVSAQMVSQVVQRVFIHTEELPPPVEGGGASRLTSAVAITEAVTRPLMGQSEGVGGSSSIRGDNYTSATDDAPGRILPDGPA